MDADPSIVYEWLSGTNELRELQLNALEQLCTEVLFCDNIDVFFRRYNPSHFIPRICNILLDQLAPDDVLEASVRAITYHLEMGGDCFHHVTKNNDVMVAIIARLDAVDMKITKSNELGQQIIKVNWPIRN